LPAQHNNLAMDQQSINQYQQQLNQAFANQDWATALTLGAQLCPHGALGVVEVMSLADYLANNGRLEAAIALYSEWLEKTSSPAAHVAWFNLAVLLINKNDLVGGEAALKSALNLQPGFIEAYINLGNLHERAHLPDLALAVWGEALSKIQTGQPDTLELEQHCLNNMGRLYKSLNRFHEADHVWLRSLALVPDQPPVLHNLVELRGMVSAGDSLPEIHLLNDISLNRAAHNHARQSIMRTPERFGMLPTPAPGPAPSGIAAPEHFYCISHAPCPWPLPDFMTVFGTGGYCPEKGIAMSLRYPEQAFKNRYLGEYVALYAIRDILIEKNATGMVGLCHYRRYALTRQHGELRGFNYQIAQDTFTGLRAEDFYGDASTPIIPTVVGFRCSVLTQYSVHCVARDLLLFFGSAIDCGAISNHEASEFLSGNYFITAPTVAFIPVEWFIEIVHTLERVMDHYFAHHYIERQGYLERSMAFCCERLHAFLLLKLAHARGFDNVIAQPLSLVAPNPPSH
jgi:tetratricopeptide (TPR) repeat protein